MNCECVKGVVTGMQSVRIVEVADYWPEVAADLSLVSWSHATNSQTELAAALQDRA